jgi:hypothetical protein
MDKIDFKKKDKHLYQPKTAPEIITVPPLLFIQVAGKGDPNNEQGEFAQAVELLYGLSYQIKMWPKSGKEIASFYDYTVPPLEGLWWFQNHQDITASGIDKDKFEFIAMIRQPEFVTESLFAEAKEALANKKPHLDTDKARLVEFDEGLCVQCMHIGSYDVEQATVAKMDEFIEASGLVNDLSKTRNHHEIYLSDLRKVAPDKLKTVIRLPVKKKED